MCLCTNCTQHLRARIGCCIKCQVAFPMPILNHFTFTQMILISFNLLNKIIAFDHNCFYFVILVMPFKPRDGHFRSTNLTDNYLARARLHIEKKKQFLVQKPSLILHITYFVHPRRELYTNRGSIHWKDTFASHFSFALSLVSKMSFAIGT